MQNEDKEQMYVVILPKTVQKELDKIIYGSKSQKYYQTFGRGWLAIR
ncbi:MAG: hypothetical protein HW421_3016 [Ignavibacteria bacterium]|nr:hypothetical protein [Ignavibacteria bacterium]